MIDPLHGKVPTSGLLPAVSLPAGLERLGSLVGLVALLTVDMTVRALVDPPLHHVATARTPIVLAETACSEVR